MWIMGRGIGLRELFVSHVSWYVVQKKKNSPRRATWRRGLLTTAQLWDRRAWSAGKVGEYQQIYRLGYTFRCQRRKKKKLKKARLNCNAQYSRPQTLPHSQMWSCWNTPNTYKAFQPVWNAHQCLLWQANAAILRCFCETAAEQWAKRCLSHISGSHVLAGPKHDCSTLEWHCVPKNSVKYTLCDGFRKSVDESQVSVQLKFMEWPDAISCALKIDESVVGKRGSFAIMYRPCSWLLQSLHTTMYHTSLCALVASSSASGSVPIVPVNCCHGNEAQRVAQHKSDPSYYQCPSIWNRLRQSYKISSFSFSI